MRKYILVVVSFIFMIICVVLLSLFDSNGNEFKNDNTITEANEKIINEIKRQKDVENKTIVNFGDSIFGNTQDKTSVSSYISKKTNMNTYNVGFGGTRMSSHAENWDAFSMYRLADEIVKENSDVTKWKIQDEAVNNEKWDNKPGYYNSALDRLKSINFDEVDIITIGFSTNDFLSNNKLTGAGNDSFEGALESTIKNIKSAYPEIKIFLVGPIYRFWMNSDLSFIEDSNSKQNSENIKLTDFNFFLKEYSVINDINFIDNYNLFNESNRLEYFPQNDGTHPNQLGRLEIGNKIGNEIYSKVEQEYKNNN